MKPIDKQGQARIRSALAAAYRERQNVQVGDSWQVRVMGQIRSMAPVYPVGGYFDLFQPFVWRLAPAACVLLLMLVAAVTQLDFGASHELADMLTEDPADFGLLAVSGR